MAFRIDPSSLAVGREDLGLPSVSNHVLNPAEAELRVACPVRGDHGPVELRGRLMGPHCPYSTTVEVAYPLRPPARPAEPGTVAARILIPEPSLWEPTCPFLYEGPVELVDAGKTLLAGQLSHGLRTLQLGPRGLRWNGRPLLLRGARREQLTEADAGQLRAVGCNALLTSLAAASALAAAADRLGFLLLARLTAGAQALASALELAEHVSCLAWLLPPEMVEQEAVRTATVEMLGGRGVLLGAELNQPLPEDQLGGIAFVVGREEQLPLLASVPRPKLLLTTHDVPSVAESADVLGRVRV